MIFHLSCIPPTANHQRKKIIRAGGYLRLGDKPSLIAAKQMIDVLLLPHRPPAPLTGPLSLALTYTWPWPKSATKKLRALGRSPRASRPDASNLCKTFEDRLVALRFLEDDGQVVRLCVEKYWGDAPGITVALAPSALGAAADQPLSFSDPQKARIRELMLQAWDAAAGLDAWPTREADVDRLLAQEVKQ